MASPSATSSPAGSSPASSPSGASTAPAKPSKIRAFVSAVEGDLIQVVKEGDSLFGKAFTFLKTEGEYVLTEIETETGKVEAFFHKSHVQKIENNVAGSATTGELADSGVAVPKGSNGKPLPPRPTGVPAIGGVSSSPSGGSSPAGSSSASSPSGSSPGASSPAGSSPANAGSSPAGSSPSGS